MVSPPPILILLSCLASVACLTARHVGEQESPQLERYTTVINQTHPSHTPPVREVEDQPALLQNAFAISASARVGSSIHAEEYIVIDGHNASLGQYLWSGRTGEYYEVPGGWPGWNGNVVAKEFYIWYWPHELARELKYLLRVRQLVADGKYNGNQWLIMHKPPGVHLTKTRAFKEAYQRGRKECDDLVEHAYEPAFNAIIDYIRRFGIYHQILNARMLWDETARNVSIFDLGDDIERDPKDADDQDLKNEVALNVYKAWPNDGIYYQDWCVNGQGQ